MSKESINRNKYVLPISAILWLILNVVLMSIFEKGLLGATPLYLPLFFAIISFIGLAICIGFALRLKKNIASLLIASLLYLVVLCWQMMTFMDILYVS